jgi:hypothetical protein
MLLQVHLPSAALNSTQELAHLSWPRFEHDWWRWLGIPAFGW